MRTSTSNSNQASDAWCAFVFLFERYPPLRGVGGGAPRIPEVPAGPQTLGVAMGGCCVRSGRACDRVRRFLGLFGKILAVLWQVPSRAPQSLEIPLFSAVWASQRLLRLPRYSRMSRSSCVCLVFSEGVLIFSRVFVFSKDSQGGRGPQGRVHHPHSAIFSKNKWV